MRLAQTILLMLAGGLAAVASPAVAAPHLGDLDDQLVFTPTLPCRIVDTRVTGTPFLAGETRSYAIGGRSTYWPTGGSLASCGIPGNETDGGNSVALHRRARAYALNITASGGAGQGYLGAWPTNHVPPQPRAVLFYGDRAAGSVIVKSCDASALNAPCASGDISIEAYDAGTDVVVDVFGYFTRADP